MIYRLNRQQVQKLNRIMNTDYNPDKGEHCLEIVDTSKGLVCYVFTVPEEKVVIPKSVAFRL